MLHDLPPGQDHLFTSFLENAPVAIAMLDRDMRYLMISRQWRIDYGLGDQTVLGRSYYELFPEIPERWKEIHQHCLNGATEHCDADPFVRADGSTVWVRWDIRPWQTAEGATGGLIMITELITDRIAQHQAGELAHAALEEELRVQTAELEHANRALQEQIAEQAQIEARLRASTAEIDTIFRALPDLIMVLDAQGRYIDISPTSSDFLPDARTDWIGKSIYDVLPSDTADYFVEQIQTALASQQTLYLDYRLTLDGRTTWFSAAVAPFREETVIWVARDVTEAHRTQIALIESEAHYRSLFEDLPISLWEEDFSAIKQYLDSLRATGVTDFEAYFTDHPDAVVHCINLAQVTDVNRSTLELFKVSSKDALRSQFSTMFPEELYTVFQQELVTLASGETRFQSERVQHTPGGEVLYTDFFLALAPGYETTWSKVFISIIDISERKQAELALEQERQLLHTLINQLPDFIYAKDLDSRFVLANQALAKAVRAKSPEAMIGLTDFDFFPHDQAAPYFADETTIFGTGQPLVNKEELFVDPNGNRRWLVTSKLPLVDPAGKITGLVGIGHDITTRKHMEEDLARLAAIVEYSGDAIASKALDGTILSWNQGAEQIYGYTAEEIIGQSVTMVVPPEEAEEEQRLLARLANGEHITPYETVRIRKDGQRIHLLMTLSPIKDETGRVVSSSVIARDITDRKQIEQALRQSEQRHRLIVEMAQEGITLVSTDATFIFVNQYVADMLGYTPDEMIGQHIFFVMSAEHQQLMRERLVQRRLGQTEHYELQLLHKSGEPLWAHISASPLYDDTGAYVGALSMVVDLTERKRAEEEIRQQAANLARSNAELQQFAYVASHDLQEPLRMVSSYLQLLERRYKDSLDTDAHEFIGYAVDGANRMKKLINDLLAYSRVGTRGEPFAPTDCEAVLERVTIDMQTTIEETGATVTHDPLPTIIGDAGQLAQLFQNLIGNAIKFRSEAAPQVHLSAVREGDHWLFSVADNGIGIDPQYAERIFIIFQRLHSIGKYPGTGIGLAICKKIVERHGGRIWPEPRESGGTVFYFTIPVIEGEVHVSGTH